MTITDAKRESGVSKAHGIVASVKSMRNIIDVMPINKRTDGPWTARLSTETALITLPVVERTSSGAYKAALNFLRR